MKKIFLCAALSLILFSNMVFAAVPAWQIIPDKSKITFTATQNGAPVSGEFTKFSGDIHFDPAQLSASHVKIIVDMNSVHSSYQEMSDNLKLAEWLNVGVYTQAVFNANSFNKMGENTYLANGTLTIRDKTVPVQLKFTLEKFSKTDAFVKGSTILKRTQFNVGTGEWAKTDTVKDEVTVDFVLTAVAH